jgi:hypothetical protein
MCVHREPYVNVDMATFMLAKTRIDEEILQPGTDKQTVVQPYNTVQW